MGWNRLMTLLGKSSQSAGLRESSELNWELLSSAAQSAQKKAYAPYSEFQVGAALQTDAGLIVSGCNVENATYGLAICAERNAISTAIAQGSNCFVGLVVIANSATLTPPCGMCLQMLAEFCLDLPIRLISNQPDVLFEDVQLASLIPRPFRWKGVCSQ